MRKLLDQSAAAARTACMLNTRLWHIERTVVSDVLSVCCWQVAAAHHHTPYPHHHKSKGRTYRVAVSRSCLAELPSRSLLRLIHPKDRPLSRISNGDLIPVMQHDAACIYILGCIL